LRSPTTRAAFQAATAALAAAGYRASRDNHHYRVIQSLELTLGKDAKFIRAFDAFRRKRNVSNYDIGMVCLTDRSGFRTGAIIAQHTPDFTSTGMLDHQKRFLFRAAKHKA
jgi:hypothetical protein